MVKSELVRLMMDMFHFGWVAGCAPFRYTVDRYVELKSVFWKEILSTSGYLFVTYV